MNNDWKLTNIPIGSKWKHKTSDDVYVVKEQYSHRVVLEHELMVNVVKKVNIGRHGNEIL